MGTLRFRKKQGDIFKVKISDDDVRYLQYVANDINLMNGNMVRVFKRRYTENDTPSPDEIVDDEIDFYCHVVLKWGVERGFWTKYGNSKDVGDLKKVFFKSYTEELSPAYPAFWSIWTIYKYTERKKLPKRFKDAYWGIIFQPATIVHKMKTGRFYDYENSVDGDDLKSQTNH